MATGSNHEDGRTILNFEYAACANSQPLDVWEGFAETEQQAGEEAKIDSPPPAPPQTGEVDIEKRLAEEARRAFEAGRERGREEGRRAERESAGPAAQAESERHRQELARLVEKFAQEQEHYLRAVEQEVVRLALAVAARILRREAQMDPLLLTGAVRVALGQLAATSEIRLRVPNKDAELWKETIALLPKLAVKPAVVADENMRLGDCVIESKVGTVDLGVRSQLGEIERGFFDRAAARQEPPEPAAAEIRAEVLAGEGSR